MKKILSIFVLSLVIAVSFTGCNNKPPFVRLADAIDSLNVQYQREHNTDENAISYDQFENVIHFNYSYPTRIEDDVFGPIAEHIKQLFLIKFITDNEFDIATEAINAKSNIIIDFRGEDNTSYEILIENNELVEAYEALHNQSNATDVTPEAAELQEEQHELMDGNVTTVE